MDWLVLIVSVSLLSLFFAAGVVVDHFYVKNSNIKRIYNLHTPEEHRTEAERLLHLALSDTRSEKHPEYSKYLREEAYSHFKSADLIENGPYDSSISRARNTK